MTNHNILYMAAVLALVYLAKVSGSFVSNHPQCGRAYACSSALRPARSKRTTETRNINLNNMLRENAPVTVCNMGTAATSTSSTTPETIASSLLDSFFEENEKEDNFYGDIGRRLRGNRDYKWLKWMDRSIAYAEFGHLPKKVIKQIPPVINAWAKKRSRFSALMVQKILTRIMDERKAGNENAIVTTVMCNTLIDAWAKSQDEEAAQKCEVILQWMIDVSSDDSEYKHDLKPNVVSYTSVIDALSKSGMSGAAERAEKILNIMQSKYENGDEDVEPNTITFNAVIDAYARTGGADMAQKAESLLERMKQLYLDGNSNVQPDVCSFNSVLFAWSNAFHAAGAPQRADAILGKMEEACGDFAHCNIDKTTAIVQPNTFCYTSCINAWGKSKEKGMNHAIYYNLFP